MFMRIQVLSLLVCLSLSGVSDANEGCFDFSKKLTEPPKKPETLEAIAPPGISKKSGKTKKGWVWAEVRGQVGRALPSIMSELKEHQTTKSKRIDRMSIIPQEDPHYLARQSIEYKVYPFPFVTVAWTEEWAFSLLRGTPQEPKQIAVFYQKTEGTNHIKHLCGAMILTQLSSQASDVFLYEEAQATGRSREDTLNGLIGTLTTLRSEAR